MALPQKFFLENMYQNTGYRANWLPDRPLRIGDIGKLDDGLFTLYTTLEQQNIAFLIREGASDLNLDYTSNDSVSIEFDANTGAVGQLSSHLEGKVVISFSNANGVLLQMSGCKKYVIENLAEVETAVLKKYSTNEWPNEWVIISETIVTDNVTIIISTSSNNRIEFGCSTTISLAQKRLADPSLNLKLISEKGSSTKILGANKLTLLYQVKGVYKPFLNKAKFRGNLDLTEGLSSLKLDNLEYDGREL